MHKVFRQALERATGQSEFVIVINIDVRDFTPFSNKTESPNTAMFIKRVYMRLIDDYFPHASFYKPAGDGLLVMIQYDENSLTEVVRSTVSKCLSLTRQFRSFCNGDPMINFDVPDRVGIGLARGTASRLESEGTILDYSGTVLNKASRFMEMARPGGIVFGADFGIDLLLRKQRDLFAKDKVYVRGIAESVPLDVYYTKADTTIPASFKKPIRNTVWAKETHETRLSEIETSTIFIIELEKEPSDPSGIKLTVKHQAMHRGRAQKGFITTFDFQSWEYHDDGGRRAIEVDFEALADRLKKNGVTPRMKVTLEIRYLEA